MRRREFLGFLTGSVASLSLTAARAKRVPTVRVLLQAGSNRWGTSPRPELRGGLRRFTIVVAD
jgi:hypothetical protein